MRYGSSKFQFILGPDDVINDVMSTNVYIYICIVKIPRHIRAANDDIFVRSLSLSIMEMCLFHL